MACPKDNKPACPKSILYATEKIIKTPILENNVRANEVVNIFGRNRRKNVPNKQIMILSDAYKELFKNENLTENLNKLSNEIKTNELVSEVIRFIEEDKKRPICTPFSK